MYPTVNVRVCMPILALNSWPSDQIIMMNVYVKKEEKKYKSRFDDIKVYRIAHHSQFLFFYFLDLQEGGGSRLVWKLHVYHFFFNFNFLIFKLF
jgi:hypothetical protein